MNLFVELSVIIVIATAISGFMKVFKQPVIIGYILTGLLLGPQFLNFFTHPETLNIFSEMGIAILLFIVGLHLNPKELADFGKSAFLIGFSQVVSTGILVFALSLLMKFSLITSIYLAVALSFSSTIVVLKLLSDKKDLEKLYGRLDIGILLFQDIIAVLALILVSSFSQGNVGLAPFALLFAQGVGLTLVVFLVSIYVLPKLSTFFARSQEYLFLFALSWGLGLASLFSYIGFSLEIGALIAGVALSVSPYSAEVSSRLKSLKEFFVVIFFILLGSRVSFGSLGNLVIPTVIFSIFTLVFKPIIIMILIGLFRYSRKTGFFSAIGLSQISEFSLILLLLGVKVGHVTEGVLSMVTVVGIVTIAFSAYLTMVLEKIYPRWSDKLRVFERKRVVKEKSIVAKYQVVLFGCNRGGYDAINEFQELGPSFLAVDFDPDIIDELEKKGINCKYGDAEDNDFLEDIGIGDAEVVISTIPDFETNIFLIEKIRTLNPASIVILLSYSIDEALKLYSSGASYVTMPHFLGGSFIAELARTVHEDSDTINKAQKEHIEYLKERGRLGHAHPRWGQEF